MNLKLARRLAGGTAVLLLLAVSLDLLAYARWVYRLEEANRALRMQDHARAGSLYGQLARPFERYGRLRTLLREDYGQLVFHRARLLYAGGSQDELLKMLEEESGRASFLPEEHEYHFWMGNALFRRALAQKKKEATREGLEQAAASYRRAVAAAPQDWDSKYNYELAMNLLAKMTGKEQEQKLRQGPVKLLREGAEPDQPQQEKIPPAKRG